MDIMYFLGVAELLTVEILILISHSSTEASISVRSRRLFCKLLSFGGTFSVRCLEIGGCSYFGDWKYIIISMAKSIGGTLFVHSIESVCVLKSLLWEVPLQQTSLRDRIRGYHSNS